MESPECFSNLELDKSTRGGQFSVLLNVIVKAIISSNSKHPSSIPGEFWAWCLDWLVNIRDEFMTILIW